MQYALVFNYSFDSDAAVYLFDTFTEAKEALRESILEEYRIDTEENGWDSTYFISEDGLYGSVVNSFITYEDITEARVGKVYRGGDNGL